MNLFRSFLIAASLWVLSGVAYAHGSGGDHLMAVVKSADAQKLVVTDKDGKDVEVAMDDKTKVEVSGKPGSVKDLKTGARVIVHTKKTDKGVVAVLVKAGAAEAHHHEAK